MSLESCMTKISIVKVPTAWQPHQRSLSINLAREIPADQPAIPTTRCQQHTDRSYNAPLPDPSSLPDHSPPAGISSPTMA